MTTSIHHPASKAEARTGTVVSAIMTTLNAEAFITEAIESVIKQTMSEWELLILDGGSTDRTLEKAAGMKDPRIRIFQIPHSYRGERLNHGVAESLGKYIIIMDADDIAAPERFERQAAYLDAHPDVSVLGSWAHMIDHSGKTFATLKRPLGHAKIRSQLFAMNGICWPTCCWRKELFAGSRRFSGAIKRYEDIDWYAKIHDIAKFQNMPEPLMYLRQTANSLGRVSSEKDKMALFTALRTTFEDQLAQPIPASERTYILGNLGICSYYYGGSAEALKFLARASARQPLNVLLWRYLVISMLLPPKTVEQLRTVPALKKAAAWGRSVSVAFSLLTEKIRK